MRLRREIEMNTEDLSTDQMAYLQGLIDMTRFLAQHPQYIDYGLYATKWLYTVDSVFDSKTVTHDDGREYEVVDYSTVTNKDEQDADVRRQLATAARQLSPCKKDYSGSTFELVKTFGPHTLTVQASRSAVCERVVVGTKTELVTDPDAPKVEQTVDVVEWRCSDSLLSD